MTLQVPLLPWVQSFGNANVPSAGDLPAIGQKLDLQIAVAKEFTIVVGTQGVTSFSVDIMGSCQFPTFGSDKDFVLATYTAPGVYTISTHWVRAVYARLTAFAPYGAGPMLSVNIAAGGI